MHRRILSEEYDEGADMKQIMGETFQLGRYVCLTIALIVGVIIVEVFIK